MTQSLMSIT